MSDMVRNLLSQLFQTWKESNSAQLGSIDTGLMPIEEESVLPEPGTSETNTASRQEHDASINNLTPFFVEPAPSDPLLPQLDPFEVAASSALANYFSNDFSDSGYDSLHQQHWPCFCGATQQALQAEDSGREDIWQLYGVNESGSKGKGAETGETRRCEQCFGDL
jgi:hypothetical protein